MKNVLIINTSLRNNSNSVMLSKSFGDGASLNNSVEYVDLVGKSIHFCNGCLSCGKTMKCVIDDDANFIVSKMLESDVLVFSTPIYYYEMSGQLKTLLDRANPLYSSKYKFREVYLLASSADNEPSSIDGAAKGIEGWVSCFDGVVFVNKLLAGGFDLPGEIKGSHVLEEAYEMGKRV